jgi:hypothetical protein
MENMSHYHKKAKGKLTLEKAIKPKGGVEV